MDGYKFLKPKNAGAKIRDPINRTPLDKNGELKPWIGREGTYWRRRVQEGSCLIIDKTAKKKEEVVFDEKDNLIKKGGK